MEASAAYSSEEILAIHLDAERLLRRRRFGMEVLYGSAILFFISFISFGALVGIAYLAGKPWPPPINSIFGIVTILGGLILLIIFCTGPSILYGFTILVINRARSTKHANHHNVEDLPPEPDIQLNEQFGAYCVVSVSESALHVVKNRFAKLTGILRLVLSPIILVVFAWLVFMLSTGRVQGKFIQAFTYLILCTVGFGWTIAPVSLQWIIESRNGTPYISFESNRWFFFHTAVDIENSELAGIHQYNGSLVVRTVAGKAWPLVSIGEDQLAHWKARRLAAAIAQRLDIVNLSDDSNDELG